MSASGFDIAVSGSGTAGDPIQSFWYYRQRNTVWIQQGNAVTWYPAGPAFGDALALAKDGRSLISVIGTTGVQSWEYGLPVCSAAGNLETCFQSFEQTPFEDLSVTARAVLACSADANTCVAGQPSLNTDIGAATILV
jgi:hypothetical protein